MTVFHKAKVVSGTYHLLRKSSWTVLWKKKQKLKDKQWLWREEIFFPHPDNENFTKPTVLIVCLFFFKRQDLLGREKLISEKILKRRYVCWQLGCVDVVALFCSYLIFVLRMLHRLRHSLIQQIRTHCQSKFQLWTCNQFCGSNREVPYA